MFTIETLREPLASAVADVMQTAGELRIASEAAARAQAKPDADLFSASHNSPWQQVCRANEHVRELTERITLRAARDGLEVNELLAACAAVAGGRKRLPDGIQLMEAA